MKEYWTTKDGKLIDVDEISIEHLKNVLKFIIRRLRENEEFADPEIPYDHYGDNLPNV